MKDIVVGNLVLAKPTEVSDGASYFFKLLNCIFWQWYQLLINFAAQLLDCMRKLGVRLDGQPLHTPIVYVYVVS